MDLSFETKEEALEYLRKIPGLEECGEKSPYFIDAGGYCLERNEYSRPTYYPRKYGKVWGIRRQVYYYSGTFNAPERTHDL